MKHVMSEIGFQMKSKEFNFEVNKNLFLRYLSFLHKKRNLRISKINDRTEVFFTEMTLDGLASPEVLLDNEQLKQFFSPMLGTTGIESLQAREIDEEKIYFVAFATK